jgi:hypothetical protein
MFWLFAPGQAEAGFPHETENEELVDDRAAKYFYVTYLPRYLGGGTFYLTGLFDSNGDMYDGKSTYKLNVPKDTPAKDFWSVIVYSMETKNFIKNAPRVGLSSRNADTMQVNMDGSYDIYFGPKAPTGSDTTLATSDRTHARIPAKPRSIAARPISRAIPNAVRINGRTSRTAARRLVTPSTNGMSRWRCVAGLARALCRRWMTGFRPGWRRRDLHLSTLLRTAQRLRRERGQRRW